MFESRAAIRSEYETRIRDIVAEHLGVGADALRPEVSLVDDLAADSLDLVEIALAIEATLGIVLPQRFLERVRTCADLVDGTVTAARRRRARILNHRNDPLVPVRARITPAGSPAGWVVERVTLLTPYGAESLAEDALRAGAGGRLELTLGPRASDDAVAHVRTRFARLGEREISVEVRREQAAGRPPHSDAA